MRVLVYEDNLMWSARLVRSLSALGHEPLVRTKVPEDAEPADAAIVNLGSSTMNPAVLVPLLTSAGIYVIGHAGHKEKELHQLGKSVGCNTLATNSELTYKLPALIERADSAS
jgi:hypothetical protein